MQDFILACDWLLLVNRKSAELYKQQMQKQRDKISMVTFPAGRFQTIRGCSIGNLKQTEQNEVNTGEKNEFGGEENE